MKIVGINGSPRLNGNTYQTLMAMGEVFAESNIDFEVLQVGAEDIRGCISCRQCAETGRCIFNNEAFDGWIEKMRKADGIVLGAPVYFASIAGTMKSFLDRAFYSSKKAFYHKVGATFATLRRTGGIGTFDALNHYLSITEMLVAPSPYWGAVHGSAPGEVYQDVEGIAVQKRVAENMVWLLNLLENGKGIVPEPVENQLPFTNFIR